MNFLPDPRGKESFVRTADAVLFPSGFQLNVGVLPALLQADDTVHSDVLNHASLIDGLRLSRPRPQILPHLAAPPPAADAWWICEALFSMDGDFADPAALRAHLAAGGHLYLDEAHSFGLHDRAGVPTGHAGRHAISPTVLVGTLGKSFGCAGAFLAASATVCTWLRGRARSFVYSTGPSPAVTAHIDHALDLAAGPEGRLRRERLWSNVHRFVERMDLPIPEPARSPIVRITAGANQTALHLSNALLERG